MCARCGCSCPCKAEAAWAHRQCSRPHHPPESPIRKRMVAPGAPYEPRPSSSAPAVVALCRSRETLVASSSLAASTWSWKVQHPPAAAGGGGGGARVALPAPEVSLAGWVRRAKQAGSQAPAAASWEMVGYCRSVWHTLSDSAAVLALAHMPARAAWYTELDTVSWLPQSHSGSGQGAAASAALQASPCDSTTCGASVGGAEGWLWHGPVYCSGAGAEMQRHVEGGSRAGGGGGAPGRAPAPAGGLAAG